jgi:hypothetical protein
MAHVGKKRYIFFLCKESWLNGGKVFRAETMVLVYDTIHGIIMMKIDVICSHKCAK